jgi:hypothetical protein
MGSKKTDSIEGKNEFYPPLLTIEEIQSRLEIIFPDTFPNRGLLVGQLSARVIYVFLYGGFVGQLGRYFRPSHAYLFTEVQARKTADSERDSWVKSSIKPGFRPKGKPWYADTSRESIRDDLMRNQFLPLGIMKKLQEGNHSLTSSKPINYLVPEFAELFNPSLTGDDLLARITLWRASNLNNATLQRMALKVGNVEAKDNDIYVEMPDKTRIRLSSGISNIIVKDLIESFASRHLIKPIVVWISASDKKSYPQFVEIAARVGLKFDLNAELPDVILADLIDPITFYLCEVVATDGAVTEARKNALLKLVRASNISENDVKFLSAFEDRESGAFRKNFSQIALNSLIWFQTEPDLLVILKTRSVDLPLTKI